MLQRGLAYIPLPTKIWRALFETKRQRKVRLAQEAKEKRMTRLRIGSLHDLPEANSKTRAAAYALHDRMSRSDSSATPEV